MSLALLGPSSPIGLWYKRITEGDANTMTRAKNHVEGLAHGVRAGGESLIVGGALGAIEAQRGSLDWQPSTNKPQVKIPIDGALAVLGLAGGIAMAGSGVHGPSEDLRNAGAAAAAIFSYRKTKEFVQQRKMGATAHGDVSFGEDPVLAAARMGG
jgi:hypothetical protein